MHRRARATPATTTTPLAGQRCRRAPRATGGSGSARWPISTAPKSAPVPHPPTTAPTPEPGLRPNPQIRVNRARGSRRRTRSRAVWGRRVAKGACMSVIVCARFKVDTDKFERLLSERKSDFVAIAEEAKGKGAIHHRFGLGDGELL